MWNGNSKSVQSWDFKKVIGKRAPQFSGFNQQDSAELLTFTLDALHEDLNRIHKKPYVEYEDAGDRPDEVVSEEYWQNFLMRNQSIIVDLMYGQLKSRVRCTKCDYVSVTFDPFLQLQVPIPSYKKFEVLKIPADLTKPFEAVMITEQDHLSVQELFSIVSPKFGIPDEKMLLTTNKN